MKAQVCFALVYITSGPTVSTTVCQSSSRKQQLMLMLLHPKPADVFSTLVPNTGSTSAFSTEVDKKVAVKCMAGTRLQT